jgi:hypothetical protein
MLQHDEHIRWWRLFKCRQRPYIHWWLVLDSAAAVLRTSESAEHDAASALLADESFCTISIATDAVFSLLEHHLQLCKLGVVLPRQWSRPIMPQLVRFHYGTRLWVA